MANSNKNDIPSHQQELERISVGLNHAVSSSFTSEDLKNVNLESFIKSTIPVDKKFSDKQPPLTRDQWRELGYNSDGWFGTEEHDVLNKLAELIINKSTEAEKILKSYRNAEMRYENEKQSLAERTKKSLQQLKNALTEGIFNEINPLDAACIIQLNAEGWKNYSSIPKETWILAGYRPNTDTLDRFQ
jgi:hypothetical protein